MWLFFLQCLVAIAALLVALVCCLLALAAAWAISERGASRKARHLVGDHFAKMAQAEAGADHITKLEKGVARAAVAWLEAAEAQIRDGRPDPIVEGAFYAVQQAARDLRGARMAQAVKGE